MRVVLTISTQGILSKGRLSDLYRGQCGLHHHAGNRRLQVARIYTTGRARFARLHLHGRFDQIVAAVMLAKPCARAARKGGLPKTPK
jgi:hypothetical protein